jgi:hypothetical protein
VMTGIVMVIMMKSCNERRLSQCKAACRKRKEKKLKKGKVLLPKVLGTIAIQFSTVQKGGAFNYTSQLIALSISKSIRHLSNELYSYKRERSSRYLMVFLWLMAFSYRYCTFRQYGSLSNHKMKEKFGASCQLCLR